MSVQQTQEVTLGRQLLKPQVVEEAVEDCSILKTFGGAARTMLVRQREEQGSVQQVGR